MREENPRQQSTPLIRNIFLFPLFLSYVSAIWPKKRLMSSSISILMLLLFFYPRLDQVHHCPPPLWCLSHLLSPFSPSKFLLFISLMTPFPNTALACLMFFMRFCLLLNVFCSQPSICFLFYDDFSSLQIHPFLCIFPILF